MLGKRLGNRTDLNASILMEMILAQETKLEGGSFLPWFLLTPTETALVSVAATETIALPADFLGLAEEYPLYLYQAANTPTKTELPKHSYATISAKYAVSGLPRAWAALENVIALAPIPDTVYDFRLRYYAKDVSVTTGNIENKWLKWAPDLFVAEVGAVMAGRYLQNSTLEQEFLKDIAVARSRLLVQHESRIHTGRTYSMGDD